MSAFRIIIKLVNRGIILESRQLRVSLNTSLSLFHLIFIIVATAGVWLSKYSDLTWAGETRNLSRIF